MELVVRKNDLLRELQLFQGIVERKNTIPILANVLMEAKGDEVRFSRPISKWAAQQVRGTVAKADRDAAGEEVLRNRDVALPDTEFVSAGRQDGVKIAADRFESRDAGPCLAKDIPSLPEPGARQPRRWRGAR
jgi:DNA polymerase-3 subunit beta